jgi:hypothetical protein
MAPTILDVIDNYWGRDPVQKIARATKAALKGFGKEVNKFYDAWQPPPPVGGELRTYFGGLVATNFSLVGKQQRFYNNLLYSHSTVVPDPIARWYFDRYEELAKTPPAVYLNGGASADQSEWVGWIFNSYRAFQWDLQTCRDVLSYFVSELLPLRPLVEARIVELVSQAHIILAKSQAIVSAAMVDAGDPEFAKLCESPIDEHPPLWDNVRGGHLTPGGTDQQKSAILLWARAKEAAYHIRKNLIIAGDCGGVYVPENKTDFALLNHVLRMSGKRMGYDNWEVKVSQDVGKLSVPSLEGLDLAELVAIRKDEVAFNEFRLWLARKLVSTGTSTDPQLIDLTSEEVEAEIAKLRFQLSASNVIKEHLRKEGLKIVVNAVIGAITGSSLGAPIGGATAGGLAGVLSSLLTRGGKPRSVLAKLARMSRVAADGTYGKSGIVPGAPRALSIGFLGEFRNGPKPTEAPLYTAQRLRKVVQASLKPNNTGNLYKAIPG